MTESSPARPASDLSDEELATQGKQLHDSRNWMFLHGSAAQFATHTARMLELEEEYLRRFPKRTWQGSGGAGEPDPVPVADPVAEVLRQVAQAPGGRLHKLEVHQAARVAGLERAELARLYTQEPRLLRTDKADRVITPAGLERLRT
ncbi:hypothetical protein NOCA2120116 [metagenome]|uniref:Uncharacterized protein n=1 Tax=metagenome TaxID=256318 RepID=A0A2P2BWG3_9ZZZZ